MLQAKISAVLKQAIRLHESGAVTQAEQIYREVLATDRNVADAWNMLAVALCQQHRLDEASQAAKHATGLRPNLAPYWLTHGNIAAERDRQREAQASFRRAIKLDPGFIEAHYWLARSYHREERLTQAIEAYRAALAGAPEAAEIHYYLARALLWSDDRSQEALQAYQQAFERDPEGTFDRRECFDHFRYLQFESLPVFWHSELIRFFRRKDIDKSRYAIAGLRVLMANPAFRALRAASEAQSAFEPDSIALEEVMRDQLFGLLLRDTLIAQPEFEILLTRLRAGLLLETELRARAPFNFLCDLALQCFNNEFVFAEAQAESACVVELEREIEAALHNCSAPDEQLTRSVAVLAMYRPLHAITGVETLVRGPVIGALSQLLRRTVSNVLDERKLRSSIPVIGTISNSVSQAVRAQYEENPYPRWLSFDRMPPISAAKWIESEVPCLESCVNFPAALRVLVAGCGTGVETLGLATQIIGVQVTAVDLSLSSLAYAQRMANELGVKNVEFRQADILELAEPPERFDVVYCVGVLMAMRDPAAGLRALLPLVRSGGLLKLGLYSKRARAAVNVAREMIRQRELPATASAIREFRQDVFAAQQNSPLKSLLQWRDFYSMSDCRDFLFHVQELQFELSEIAAMLRENGLTVLGMSKQLPRAALFAYRQMFPRDKTRADLQNWDAVEKRHPETFLGMYQIWCRKLTDAQT